jgi:hypothetical protein
MVEVVELGIQGFSQLFQCLRFVFIPMYDANVQHLWDISSHRIVPHIFPLTPSVDLAPYLNLDLVRFLTLASTVLLESNPLQALRRSCRSVDITR